MINITEKKRDDLIWVVSQELDKIIYPQSASYYSKESETGTKLAFIVLNGKRVCYPVSLLFETKIEAEIYACIIFIKLYYSLDPFTIVDDIDEATLLNAHKMIETYEETHPDKFLYYWMHDVPNR